MFWLLGIVNIVIIIVALLVFSDYFIQICHFDFSLSIYYIYHVFTLV